MEANTTMTICANGHPYDTAKTKVCPKCGALPAGSNGTFSATEPVSGSTVMGSYGGMGATEPVGMPGATAAAVDGNFTPTVSADANYGEGVREPVVGWLVCISGPNFGDDYRIHGGYNYIGRSTGDICIKGDDKISRESHAMIAYDSSELAYYFGPAGGRNLVKVNNKTVLNATEIHAYDIISIGPRTKLIFVPLCGEHFSWPSEDSQNG